MSGVEISTIIFERTPCMGRCPNYRVSLRRDGSAHYDGIGLASLNGEFVATINKPSFDSLSELIVRERFFEMEDHYSLPVFDLPGTITTVKLLQGESKRVARNGAIPSDSSLARSIRLIERAIDSVANSLEWQSE